MKEIEGDEVASGEGTAGARRRRREEMEWCKLLLLMLVGLRM